MKILKVFGLVAGIHILALMLIFANPGCTSTTRPPPVPIDTAYSEPPVITVPNTSPAEYDAAGESPVITFNPDVPAGAASFDSGVRYNPTRPGSPAAGTLITSPVTDVTPATTYTVVPGDTLSGIAKKQKSTVAAIAAANKMKTGATLRPGQKLLIPGKAPSAAAAGEPVFAAAPPKPAEVAPAKYSGDAVKHVVRSGETLSGIARQYGVRTGEIAVINNIVDPKKIRPGMELIIPGWHPPATKSDRAVQQKTAPDTAPTPSPPRSTDARPTIDVTSDTPSRAQPEVPVIRVDDSPLTPAPKNP